MEDVFVHDSGETKPKGTHRAGATDHPILLAENGGRRLVTIKPKPQQKLAQMHGPILVCISAERFLNWKKKNVQYYSCELGFIWGKMRTVSWETAF